MSHGNPVCPRERTRGSGQKAVELGLELSYSRLLPCPVCMKGLCSGRIFFSVVCLFFTNIGGGILNARGVTEQACYRHVTFLTASVISLLVGRQSVPRNMT